MPTVPLCGLKSCRHVEYNAGPNPPAERLRIPRPSAGLFVRGQRGTNQGRRYPGGNDTE